ncbi:Hypothetical predicted protein [Olea europaea subsp. europaea]|uniref:Uncharacterized protein n=1 Tax=Olea europaea subsp. europaea TaxID=158383 RepID=A0A8S0QGP1_OLEEU|nr:Hypothetical predicted protein [Olea europaea subsp. europaea]
MSGAHARSQVFWAVSGTRQFNGTWCVGHVQVATSTQPDLHAFLGSFWDTPYGPCPEHVLAAGTVCKNYLGFVRVAAGMQPDFQGFVGSFWGIVCRSCPGVQCLGCNKTVPGMQPDFQTFLGSFWDTVMLETRSGHGRGEAYIQVILGSFWARFTGHVWNASLPGHIQDASGPWQGQSLIFRHFLSVSGSRCAGYVRDASWPGQGRRLIFRQFRVVFGHDVLAVSETPPGQRQGRSLIFRHFYAIFGTRHATARMQPDLQAILDSFWVIGFGV